MTHPEERCVPASFYERPTLQVARDLLGQRLVRVLSDGTRLSGRIIETEAYTPDDPSSHAYRGPTGRSRTMFGPAGLAYVYLIYGMYYCLNVVTQPEGQGAAVLFRALDSLEGTAQMQENYANPQLRERDLTRGPGRLCRALAIDRSLNQTALAAPGSPLYIIYERDLADDKVLMTPRIGINATPEAIAAPWRFIERDNQSVSGSRRQNLGQPYSALLAQQFKIGP